MILTLPNTLYAGPHCAVFFWFCSCEHVLSGGVERHGLRCASLKEIRSWPMAVWTHTHCMTTACLDAKRVSEHAQASRRHTLFSTLSVQWLNRSWRQKVAGTFLTGQCKNEQE